MEITSVYGCNHKPNYSELKKQHEGGRTIFSISIPKRSFFAYLERWTSINDKEFVFNLLLGM